MAKKAKIQLPVAPLPDLIHWWRAQETRGVLIGGLAVSLLSRPRVTRDIDVLILVPENQWAAFLESGKAFGFLPRFADTLELAREARVLLLRHEPTGIDIDAILGSLPFEEEAIARASHKKVSGIRAPLPTPEDMVIMKAIAHREQDMLDIGALIAAHPAMDTRRVRRWVRNFANALDAPELLSDLNRVLAQQSRRRRNRKES